MGGPERSLLLAASRALSKGFNLITHLNTCSSARYAS